jgi:hypothetical protein
MDRVKRHILSMYTDRHLWKLNSDEHFTPEVVRGVYRNLVDAGVIPSPENDFLFVSPTANVPTHETTLFNQDQKTRTGKATFLVGDICPGCGSGAKKATMVIRKGQPICVTKSHGFHEAITPRSK